MTTRSSMRYKQEQHEAKEKLAALKRKVAPPERVQRERIPISPTDIVDTFMDSPDRMSEE